jgi:hypothetical protein
VPPSTARHRPVVRKKAPDYVTWKASAAAALEREHKINAGAIPPRVWRHLYVLNLSPEKAAEQTAVSAYNARPAFGRKR